MKYKNHLRSLKATLVDYPDMEKLKSYIPEFAAITWLEKKEDIDTFLESRNLTRETMVHEMFAGRTLPTALETVRLTFFIEGLDLTNVTHIIRHRLFSFSAQSTDPVTMENHDILDNDAFIDISGEKNQEVEKTPQEEFSKGLGLETHEKTGRNEAYETFSKVEKQILASFDSLENEEDRNVFKDYLLTNLKLYFDKFENELTVNLTMPTTPEYEQEKHELTSPPGPPEGPPPGIF